MKKRGKKYFFIFFAAVVAGCATVYEYKAEPAMDSVDNSTFQIRFEPLQAPDGNFFDAFLLVIENRMEDQLKIEWKNTHYLLNGKPYGLFGWEGMTAEELKNIRELPEVSIQPGKVFSKKVFPLKLAGYQTLARDSTNSPTFSRGILPEGRNGIRLAGSSNERKIEETLTVEITKEEVNR